MSFRVIAGSGHCGTMWLARVLDSVPGQRWTHELRTTAADMPWWEADGMVPSSPAFDVYWSWIEASLERHDVVGDSNSWPPEKLPYIHEYIQPIEKVIYLTRDKGKQLHSILNHSPVWSARDWPDVAWKRLAFYAEIAGDPSRRDPALLVEANDFMPDWLREQGLTVDVYSLEDLTTNLSMLRSLAPLTGAELQAWQQRDINKKVAA